jgi:hypothetical protein
MSVVSDYPNDVFISYSHIDNQPIDGAGGGWVDTFHELLQNFVDVHLGRRTTIWRDRRLTGADIFSNEIEQQLRASAVLVSIISPGYLQSDWCNRELFAFTRAADDGRSLRIGNLLRVVKVLRLPAERSALPPVLDNVLGAQFYRVDPASGRARDLLLDPAADAPKVFRARVDDVAQDLSRLLTAMAASGDAAAAAAPPDAADTVFLAWSTADLSEEREKLRRELEARRFRVVPAGAPPLEAARLRDAVADALREAKVAIHLIGAHYGFVPEGDERSVIELQIDAAATAAAADGLARILWLAPNEPARDPRLDALVSRVQRQALPGRPIDMLVNQSVETLKALVLDRLKPAPAPLATPAAGAGVYLICDPLDRESVTPLQDFLFDQSIEVRLPLFEGEAEDVREEHYETLKECDGVLIFWGKGREGWLRTMLRDLNKVFGLGRADAFKAASLYLADLPDASKESFRTRQLSIIKGDAPRFDPAPLAPFLSQLGRA